MKNIIKSLIIISLFILVYLNKNVVVISVINSIDLFNKAIFPSIFPIMIISDLILSTNIINYLSNTIGIIFSKFFKLSKYSGYVFIMSMICGTPSCAKYLKDLLDNNCITKKEAQKILPMVILYNPLLIISLTTYLSFYDSCLVIIINIIINLIIGLINRNYKIEINDNKLIPKKFNLVESINNTLSTLISIFGIITTFNILNNLLPIKHPLITGILEITNGLNLVNVINTSYQNKLLYTGILLSFSGLSIITQIKSIFKKDTLDFSLFYKSRIIHLIITIVVYYCFFNYL